MFSSLRSVASGGSGESFDMRLRSSSVMSISNDLSDGSNFSFLIPKCNMSGHNLDMADEGVFVEIPFTVTSGPDGSGTVPITIKMT